MQSDERVLSFSKTTPLEKASPLRTQGKWGMGGNPRSLCGQKRLSGSCSLDPSLPASYVDLTGFQGHRLDMPTRCACNGSEPHGCRTWVCISASSSLGQGSPSCQARFERRGQLHGAEALSKGLRFLSQFVLLMLRQLSVKGNGLSCEERQVHGAAISVGQGKAWGREQRD